MNAWRGPLTARRLIWEVLGPTIEGRRSKLGPVPEPPGRRWFEAVRYRARTGIPWRDLPASFGAWDAVYNRLRRWIHPGRRKKLFDLMARRSECEDARRLRGDSTVVRARQVSAGARRKMGRARNRPSAGRAAASRRG